MKKILSIDGGGIRGIIPALIIAEIEHRMGKPAWQLFDLIAGTSTGGIIALGLTVPIDGAPGIGKFSAKMLADLYEHQGQEIFPWNVWRRAFRLLDERYSQEGIEHVLFDYFGDAMVSTALTDVLVTAYDIERRDAWVFRRSGERDFMMRDVARATSAAPTYFEPHRIDIDGQDYLALVDGGVFANNPSLLAVATAETYDIALVSLGTGNRTERIPLASAQGWGLAGWAKPILDIVMDSGPQVTDHVVRRLLPTNRYWRLQPTLDPALERMDNASDDNIRSLRLLAERFIAENQDRIDQICEVIR